jgi:hypothetical protein
METLHVILLMIGPLYRAGDPSVCSILHIFGGKEETKVGGSSELLMGWSAAFTQAAAGILG